MREVIWKHLFSLKWMLPFGSVIVSILLVIDHQSINEINKMQSNYLRNLACLKCELLDLHKKMK